MLKRIKGFTLIELLIVVAIIAILAAIAIPNFLEAQVRSKVSRAAADMRSVGTAVEAYYVDNFSYPASDSSIPSTTQGYGVNDDPNLARADTDLRYYPTFRHKANSGEAVRSMTTPVSYIATFPNDAFTPVKGARLTFSYSLANPPMNDKWLMWSCGPDLVPDIHAYYSSPTAVPVADTAVYPANAVPSKTLIALTYDPSNGTESPGDLYRFKQ